MSKNIAQLDLLRPGSMAFKGLMNQNWKRIDASSVVQRSFSVRGGSFVLAGYVVAFDTSSGDLVAAVDDSSSKTRAFGFSMDTSLFSGLPVTIRMIGKVPSSVIIQGTPAVGDILYLSSTQAGAVSTTPGPNKVVCGVFDGTTLFFRPRLTV